MFCNNVCVAIRGAKDNLFTWPSFVTKLADKLTSTANRISVKIRHDPFGATRNFATFVGVAGCILLVWLALQPSLIFTNTTPTGGDMGAHVWWPAFMRDFLLPNGRLFGWSMDNYSGFPAGQYYFPVPAVMVVILDVFLPYNIAFKLVTVIGSVALPLAAYILGRSIKVPKPIPMLMAFAATLFLFFTGDPRGTSTASTVADYNNANFNHHIMGGPLLSSMAGEFSFSIALVFALLFLSAFFVMLRDGKYRCWVAILFALTVMSHLVVAIFLGIATLVFWGASYIARKGIVRWLGYALLLWVCVFALCIGSIGRYFFDHTTESSLFFVAIATLLIVALVVYGFIKDRIHTIGVARDAIPLLVGFLLSSIWLLPLLTRFGYTSNMRYEKLVDLPATQGVNEVYELYIAPNYFLWPVFIPAAIGFVLSATFLRKSIIPLIVTAVTMGVVFVNWPEGHAWNLRFLPFWYLFIFFVAAVGYGELIRLPGVLISRSAYVLKNRNVLLVAKILRTGISIATVIIFFVLLVGVGSTPKDALSCLSVDTRDYPDRRGYADSWARYNFEGYERKPQATDCGIRPKKAPVYNSSIEFKSLMDEMKKLPAGRALWETSKGAYGTTLALTLLPYYTDHRIASQEGLYYEAAGSTAYHFLTVAEVSQSPSNPMRWPKCETKRDGTKKEPTCFDSYYGTISDFSRGVAHMKMMGVRYYLANTEEAKAAANAQSDLTLIAQVKDRDDLDPFGWNIYRIEGSYVVEPLAHDPVVITDKSDPKDWAQSGNKWLYDWFVAVGEYPVFTNDGPNAWKHETSSRALARPLSTVQQQEKANVKVSNVKITQDSVSFHVDKVGEPVLIKVSYYPTFSASGAETIYRASPNSMVVIPTKKEVTISIKRDGVEWIANLAFLAGIAGCILMKVSEKQRFKQLSGLFLGKVTQN